MRSEIWKGAKVGWSQDGRVERHTYAGSPHTAHKIPVERDSQQILEQQKWRTTKWRRFPAQGDLKDPWEKSVASDPEHSPAQPWLRRAV